jgi:hypothetical protein
LLCRHHMSCMYAAACPVLDARPSATFQLHQTAMPTCCVPQVQLLCCHHISCKGPLHLQRLTRHVSNIQGASDVPRLLNRHNMVHESKSQTHTSMLCVKTHRVSQCLQPTDVAGFHHLSQAPKSHTSQIALSRIASLNPAESQTPTQTPTVQNRAPRPAVLLHSLAASSRYFPKPQQ